MTQNRPNNSNDQRNMSNQNRDKQNKPQDTNRGRAGSSSQDRDTSGRNQ